MELDGALWRYQLPSWLAAAGCIVVTTIAVVALTVPRATGEADSVSPAHLTAG